MSIRNYLFVDEYFNRSFQSRFFLRIKRNGGRFRKSPGNAPKRNGSRRNSITISECFCFLLPRGHGQALPPFNSCDSEAMVIIFFIAVVGHVMTMAMMMAVVVPSSIPSHPRCNGWLILCHVMWCGWVAVCVCASDDEGICWSERAGQ